VVVGLGDGTVRFVQLNEMGREVQIHKHAARVTAILSPKDGEVISAAQDGSLVFSTCQSDAAWKPQKSVQLSNPIMSMSRSDSGKVYAVLRDDDRTLKFVDVQTLQPIAIFDGFEDEASAKLSPDLKWCVAWHRTTYAVAPTETLSLAESMKWQETPFTIIHDISFSADSTTIALACEDGILVRTLSPARDVIFVRSNQVRKIRFLNADRVLGYVTGNGDLVLWNVYANREIARFQGEGPFRGRQDLEIDSDGKCVISAATAAIGVRDVFRTPERITQYTHDAKITGIAIYPDRKSVATLAGDGAIHLSRLADGKLLRSSKSLRSPVAGLSIHPSMKLMAAGGQALHFIDSSTLQVVGEIDYADHQLGWIEFICFSPDGQFLAACGGEGAAVWRLNVPSGESTTFGVEHLKPVSALSSTRCVHVQFDASSQWIAWNVMGSGNIRAKRIGSDTVYECPSLSAGYNLGFEPFGKEANFLFLDNQGRICTWSPVEQDSVTPLGISDPTGRGLLGLSANGTRLAIRKRPSIISIWNPQEGRRLYDLPAEDTSVYHMKWSDDGTKLLLGLADGTLVIWDLERIDHTLTSIGLN
jgi:WD40 repeat protein